MQHGSASGELFSTELAKWRDRWLVIDDYHILMESPATEALIEEVVRQSQVPLLRTSRRRPSWITARQIQYGEVVEIGRNALAMTAEEAALVLEANNARTLPGLVSIAEGWPAVI